MGDEVLVNRYDIINADLGVAITTVIGMLTRATPSVCKQMTISGGNRFGKCSTLYSIAHYDVDEAILDYENRLKDTSLEKYHERIKRIIKTLTILKKYKLKNMETNNENATIINC